ncbi:hypothetical protein BC830DRAFT_1119885 [Chytriomyces sp. MP71]|nr:hypothetical protein BC830DRAFT_1119885 [Chytriomyces sp. MP71]
MTSLLTRSPSRNSFKETSSSSGNTQYLERFEVVGTGASVTPDGRICVSAGWDCESELTGAVALKLGNKLRHVRIQAEFRGYMETRWEASSLAKEAVREEADDYKIRRNGRAFQQIVQVVYDAKDPILPVANGGSNYFPFKFTLPKTFMPPSFDSIAGTVQYYVKCSMLYQEGINLLKSNVELEVPVTIVMPEGAKMKMLMSPSHMHHQGEKADDKVEFSVEIQKRILTIGDTLEVDVIIHSTPKDTRIRSISASLRSIVAYINVSSNIGSQAKVPRPLSEMSQAFPLLKVGNGGVEPIARRVFLLVDPELAVASFESPFISSKTIFRLEIIIDDNETPNISYEVPIVAVPQPGRPTQPLLESERYRHPYESPQLNPRRSLSSSIHSSPSLGPLYSPIGLPVVAPPGYFPDRKASTASSSIFDAPPHSANRSLRSTETAPNYYSPIIHGQPGWQLPHPQSHSQPKDGFRAPPVNGTRMPRSKSLARGGGSPRIHPRVDPELERSHSLAAFPAADGVDRAAAQALRAQMQRSASLSATRGQGSPRMRSMEEGLRAREVERLNGEQARLAMMLAEMQEMDLGPGRNEADNASTTSSTYPREDWNVQMVADWIRQLGADDHVVQKFFDQQVDGVVLRTLNGEDLRNELGVALLGLRRKIMVAIDKLNQNSYH